MYKYDGYPLMSRSARIGRLWCSLRAKHPAECSDAPYLKGRSPLPIIAAIRDAEVEGSTRIAGLGRESSFQERFSACR